MKRRRVSIRDQLKSLEKAKEHGRSFPDLTSGTEDHFNGPNLPGSLKSVFEILLPLETKTRSRAVASNKNVITEIGEDKELGKQPFHLCTACGNVEELCRCVGSGDYETKSSKDTSSTVTTNKVNKNYKYGKNKHPPSIEELYSLGSKDENISTYTDEDDTVKNSGQGEKEVTGSEDLKKNEGSSEDTENSDEKMTIEDDQNEVDSESVNNSIFDMDIFSQNLKTIIENDGDVHHLFFNTESNDSQNFPQISCHRQNDSDFKSPAQVWQRKPEYNVRMDLLPTLDDSFSFKGKPQSPGGTLTSDAGDHGTSDEVEAFEQMSQDEFYMEYDQRVDSSIIVELLEAEEQSKRTANLINHIKDSIIQFQSKEHLTEEDTLVINIKQVELKKKLTEFEEITHRVQKLVELADMKNLLPKIKAAKEPLYLRMEEQRSPMFLDVIPEQDECKSKEDDVLPSSDFQDTEYSEDKAEEVTDEEPMEELDLQKATEEDSFSESEKPFLNKEEEISKFMSMDKIIPKVIVCGTENQMPRIIVCEKMNVPSMNLPSMSSFMQPQKMLPEVPLSPKFSSYSRFDKKDDVPNIMMSLTGELSESYSLQEKLVSENAALEDGRYRLQEELLKRDNIVDALHRQVGCLQTEMRIVSRENTVLQEKLSQINKMDCACGGRKQPAGAAPHSGGGTSAHLERQLNLIEGEVRSMQSELQQVQKERQQLEHQRSFLTSTGKGGARSCVPTTCGALTCNPPRGKDPEQALRDLREQYNRLQRDFKDKVTEVACLRRDIDKMKCMCESAQEAQEAAEQECRCVKSQLQTVEHEKKKMIGSKEQMIDREQQLAVAKQKFREAQDELDELRTLVQDQTTQMEDYRNKYLHAQQQVEEQRRQIDIMELENTRISEQVNMEIMRVKNQFQEKLQELTPLPDILKATQMKLKDCEQVRIMAEQQVDELNRELQDAKEQIEATKKQLEDSREKEGASDDMVSKMDELDRKYNQAKDENAKLRTELIRLDEIASQAQRRLEEKMHEAAQLAAQLETVREESARQVTRTKERCDTMRRSLQCQVAELERQLAQSRAVARSAQKDRDEIRQRMQCQINNLNESFEQAQMRIRGLQSHVNFLKTSYTNIFEEEGMDCSCPSAGGGGIPHP